MASKIEREREFHDRVFTGSGRARVKKFYDGVNAGSHSRYLELLRATPPGSKVLEWGSGPESFSHELAHSGCQVTAIDISGEAIRQAQAKARGLDITFRQMDVEELDFPAGSFDLVCGAAIVHHVDTARALEEAQRVLRDTGRAVFREPLGHNPAIRAYRNRTPELRTPDEHPLLRTDLELARQTFPAATFEFYELTTLAAVPLRKSRVFLPALRVLRRADEILLRSPLRYWAWNVVMELKR